MIEAYLNNNYSILVLAASKGQMGAYKAFSCLKSSSKGVDLQSPQIEMLLTDRPHAEDT